MYIYTHVFYIYIHDICIAMFYYPRQLLSNMRIMGETLDDTPEISNPANETWKIRLRLDPDLWRVIVHTL